MNSKSGVFSIVRQRFHDGTHEGTKGLYNPYKLRKNMLLKGLPPVIDENTEILILGSFPGPESLRKKQYYANNRNYFWKIMGQVLDSDLISKSYEEMVKILLNNKIGLWDVFASCEREGSSDKNIFNERLNDFKELKVKCPKLKLICFNGCKSAEHSNLVNQLNIKTAILLSTSPANTSTSFDNKLKQWSEKIGINNN